MSLNRTTIEEILKKAIERGELHLEFSDDDIDFLLAHSIPTKLGRPSNERIAQLEQILLDATAERESLEMVIREKAEPYKRLTSVEGVDVAQCPAGDALHEQLRVSGWTVKQALEKLGVSERIVEGLLNETLTITSSTARRVAALLSARYHFSNEAEELLGQWLLNGLRLWELRHASDSSGLVRKAARVKHKGKRK